EQIAVRVRYLVAVAMSLAHFRLSVDLRGARSPRKFARIGAESHGAAHVGDVLLRLHERDDGVVSFRRERRRVTVVETAHVPREFDDGRLHAEADAEKRQARLTRAANRLDHP